MVMGSGSGGSNGVDPKVVTVDTSGGGSAYVPNGAGDSGAQKVDLPASKTTTTLPLNSAGGAEAAGLAMPDFQDPSQMPVYPTNRNPDQYLPRRLQSNPNGEAGNSIFDQEGLQNAPPPPAAPPFTGDTVSVLTPTEQSVRAQPAWNDFVASGSLGQNPQIVGEPQRIPGTNRLVVEITTEEEPGKVYTIELDETVPYSAPAPTDIGGELLTDAGAALSGVVDNIGNAVSNYELPPVPERPSLPGGFMADALDQIMKKRDANPAYQQRRSARDAAQ